MIKKIYFSITILMLCAHTFYASHIDTFETTEESAQSIPPTYWQRIKKSKITYLLAAFTLNSIIMGGACPPTIASAFSGVTSDSSLPSYISNVTYRRDNNYNIIETLVRRLAYSVDEDTQIISPSFFAHMCCVIDHYRPF